MVLTTSFVVYRAFNISMFENSSKRNFMRGDGYSDINLYSAVKFFNDSGILKTKALPVHYYKVPLTDTVFKPTVYTHYPALPDILAFTYSKIIQSDNEFQLRLFMILLSLCFSFLLFVFFSKIFENKNTVIWACSILMFSNYYLGWADSLHKHIYEELFKLLFLIFFLKYDENKKILYLFLMILVSILVANVSFEPIVYLFLIVFVFNYIKYKKIFHSLNFIIGFAFFFGVLLHIYQNVLYFGSLELALKDLTETAKLRTAGIEINSKFKKLESEFGIWQYFQMIFVWLNRMERFFIFPAWSIIAIYIFLKKLHQFSYSNQLLKWILIFFISSYSWNLVMGQHAYVHAFTGRQSGFLYAIILAPLIQTFYFKVKDNFKNYQLKYKIASILIILYSIVMFFTQQVWDLWLKNTFLN